MRAPMGQSPPAMPDRPLKQLDPKSIKSLLGSQYSANVKAKTQSKNEKGSLQTLPKDPKPEGRRITKSPKPFDMALNSVSIRSSNDKMNEGELWAYVNDLSLEKLNQLIANTEAYYRQKFGEEEEVNMGHASVNLSVIQKEIEQFEATFKKHQK